MADFRKAALERVKRPRDIKRRGRDRRFVDNNACVIDDTQRCRGVRHVESGVEVLHRVLSIEVDLTKQPARQKAIVYRRTAITRRAKASPRKSDRKAQARS